MHAKTPGRTGLNLGIVRLAQRTIAAWFSHDAASVGASLSFYTLFSIAPVLLIATWTAGAVLDKDVVHRQIVAQMRNLIGDAGAGAVGALLAGSATHLGSGVFASVIGIVSLLIGATSVFAELQHALDRVWGSFASSNAARSGRSGVWQYLRTRLLSFGLILGVGFLLLVSLVVSAALAAIAAWFETIMVQWQGVLWAVDTVMGLGIATLLFAMIFKFLPRTTVAWGDVWIGALVTAALFGVGKALIGVYLSKSVFMSGYGVAGSFLILLLWIYYSAQIFLLGAEFTRAFAYEHGSLRGTSWSSG
jgi:membrane protein